MTNLLFQTPWWLPTLLIGTGVILFWSANRRQETRLRNIGLLLIAAAAVLCTVSYLVDTDLEKCTAKTKQLIHDIEKQDWTDMATILDTHATVGMSNSFLVYTNRNEIISGAKAAVAQYGVKNVHILSTESQQADTLITVSMSVLSDHDNPPLTMLNTGWQVEWQESGGKWSLVRIICLKIGNQKGDDAAGHFPRTR